MLVASAEIISTHINELHILMLVLLNSKAHYFNSVFPVLSSLKGETMLVAKSKSLILVYI